MFKSDIDKSVTKWLTQNKEDIIKKYIELCRIPSVKQSPAPGAPFGADICRTLKYLRRLFSEAGFLTDDGGGYYITSRYGDKKRTLGIFAHADVVPAGDNWLFTKPFEPIISENTLIGRGVSDNKSGIMAAYLLMRLFKELNLPLSSSLFTYVGGGEETGMEDLHEYLKKETEPDFCFVPDSRFPCCIGERGSYEFLAKSNCRTESILTLKSGTTSNAVSDSACITIPSNSALVSELRSKSENSESIRIRFSDPIEISAKGLSAHASNPSAGVNALLLLADFVSGLESLPAADRTLMRETAFLLSDTTGKSLGIDMRDELFGALCVTNGISYLEDGRLVLGFNVRYGNIDGKARIEENAAKTLTEHGMTFLSKINKSPFVAEKDSEAVKILTKIYNEMSGLRPEVPFAIGGTTYAGMLKNALAVGTCVGKTPDGFIPGKEMPKGHGGAHAPDEKIYIDGFFDAIRVLVQYVIAADENPDAFAKK